MFFTTNPPSPESLDPELIQAITNLNDGKRSASDVLRFSDVDRGTAVTIMPMLRALSVDARRFVVRQMVEQSETNVEINFARTLHQFADDPDAEVRVLAIQGLWEDEDVRFAVQLLDMLETEFDPAVREAIVQGLGRFSYLSVTGNVDDDLSSRVHDTLMELFQSDEPIAVRRRALESVAYFEDEAVEEAIAEAFDSIIHDLHISSIFSMGRNLSDRWFSTVLGEMQDSDPEIRFEAVRASGEFGDERAVNLLLDLVDDEDAEVRMASIAALGQIGGKVSVGALRRLARDGDTVVSETAQEALSQAIVSNDPMRLTP